MGGKINKYSNISVDEIERHLFTNLFQKKMADPKYANLPGIVSSYLQSINYQAYVKENIYIIFSGYRPARFI